MGAAKYAIGLVLVLVPVVCHGARAGQPTTAAADEPAARRCTQPTDAPAGAPRLGISAEHLLLAGLILLAAGALQGAVGFGSGLVSVGLIGAMVGIRQASIAFCFPALVLCLLMLYRLREHFRWQRVAPVAVSLVVGVPLGVWFFVRAEPRVLEIVLGSLMAVTVVYNLTPRLARRPWHPVFAGIPCGLLSGAISGALSTGGPSLVAYLSTQRFGRLRFVASLQVLFVINTSVRLVELIRRDVFTPATVSLGLVGAVALPLGALVGLRLLKKIPDRPFRWIVLVLLTVLAIRYLLP